MELVDNNNMKRKYGGFRISQHLGVIIRSGATNKTRHTGLVAARRMALQLLRNGIFDVVVLSVHLASYVRIV